MGDTEREEGGDTHLIIYIDDLYLVVLVVDHLCDEGPGL